MTKSLVIVESPAKAKTIEKFLGKNFSVKASMGHLRDLPKSQFGVDIENDFMPKYINIRGKGPIIKSLKDAAKKADRIYLATDPDREGEAIAWHLAHILNVPEHENTRIEFNEITKNAIQTAIKNPRVINAHKVDAQQTRRILDRIVGYKLSPLLWRKVRKGLSAGRVQSVAVRLICDRENEINSFESVEYWSVEAKLRDKPKGLLFIAELAKIDGKKAVIANEAQATLIENELKKANFSVKEISEKKRRRYPPAPFITSSLQQESVRKLGFTTRKTMMLAQQMYEGLEVGSGGQVGLITYMRTDSTRIAQSAQTEARDFIKNNFGSTYLPEKPPVYSNKNSQDAHEAIRPTSIELTPEKIRKYLTQDQLKLYTLIWTRCIASQMEPAIYNTMSVLIQAGKYELRATGSVLDFNGFLVVYNNDKAYDDKDTILPELKVDQNLVLYKILPKQHFTEPPPRYTEASLVKMLEEQGIGRPSTYSPIIQTILERGYVEKIDKKFAPTELGFVVVDLLKEYFPDIVDMKFTANLESRLDDIADGERSWIHVLNDFFKPFSLVLQHAEAEISQVEIPNEVTDIPCEKCGKFMVIKHGRYGRFLACPGFPECKNAKPIQKDMGVKCPLCNGTIVEKRSKKKRKFYGCENYPNCNFVTWDLPLNENCEICGSFLVRHSFNKGGFVKSCSNPSCEKHYAVTEPKKRRKSND